MRIFVTDGDSRAALAVTRSLGRAGHEVIVGERRQPALAQVSRHCSRRIVYPNPVDASEEFIEFTATVIRDQRIEMLMPVADVTTLLCTRHRHRFEPHCAVPFAAAETVARAADKVNVFETATRIGVPVPRSVIVTSADRIPMADLEFPLVIKPARSRVETGSKWVSSTVSFAADADTLRRDLRARPAHEFPLLLQERIVGPGVGVFACYHRGRPLALFAHRRLRERPPWGGVSVLAESVRLDEVTRDSAVRLLDEIGWQGVAMVEFKRDCRDGMPKLMEINGRFWGSLQLAVDAGVDFPALLAQTGLSGGFAPPPPYRVGVRSRWFWGDVDSLLLELSGRARPMGVLRSRSSALVDFLRLWSRNLYYENPRWDDLGPWWHETRGWLRKGFHVATADAGLARAAS